MQNINTLNMRATMNIAELSLIDDWASRTFATHSIFSRRPPDRSPSEDIHKDLIHKHHNHQDYVYKHHNH